MPHFCRITSFLAFVFLAAPALAERPYTPEITVERWVDTHDVRADGSDRETTEYVFRIETAQGVSDQGAQRISYRSGVDDVESIEASTIKADGTVINIPASAIRTQDEDSDGGATHFSDTKYKVIVFPAVEVGGRVHVRATVNHRSTPFPKFFADTALLSPEWNWEDWEMNISIPASLALYVEQRGIKGSQESAKDGVNHYHFSYKSASCRISSDWTPLISSEWDHPISG